VTKLDKFLTARDWTWNGEEFVTVCDGLGFVIYKVKLTMILAGVAPSVLAEHLANKGHWVYDKPGPFGVLAKRGGGRLAAHLFEIPADPEVVAAAVSSAFNMRF
jgi:hypothetical protein